MLVSRIVAFFCFFLIFLPLSTRPSSAQQVLEGIVIAANRGEEDASRIGSSVTRVSREQIEAARAENVLEALQTVPGLTVNQAGGVGGATSVFIRGADSDQTLVLIDGARVNDPAQAQGEFDFSMFTLANVERIEVLRGPQSGLYGSDAIGGVINIITRKGEGAPQATVEAEGGSYKTHAERAFVSAADNGVAVSAAASNFRTSGFSRDARFSEDDATEKQSANLRFDADIAPNASFTFSAGRYWLDAEIDTSPQRGEDDAASKTLSTAALTGRLDLFEGMIRNKATLYANKTERIFFEDDASSRPGKQAQTDYFDGSRFGLEAQSDIAVREVDRLTLGGRVEQEAGEQTSVTSSGRSLVFSGEEMASAAFALYEFNPFEALTLTAALRSDDFGSAGIEKTYRFTAAFRIPETGTKLRGSFGAGAKAPTLFQRFSRSNLAIGNPDLEAETSEGFDLGVDQSFMDGRLTFSATYFHNDIENLIEFFDPDGFGEGEPGTYENIKAARTEGWELSAGFAPLAWLKLDAAYAYLDAIDASTGAQLQRRPERTVGLRLTLSPDDKLRLATAFLYVGERYNNEDRQNPLDAYLRIDMNGSYKLREDAEIFFRVENLTNAQYEEIQNFGTADRSVYAGLRARF